MLLLNGTSDEVQDAFTQRLTQLFTDPLHPALGTRLANAETGCWQARLTKDWSFSFRIVGDLYELVVRNPSERLIERHPARHGHAGVDDLVGSPMVGKLLALGGIARHVRVPGVLADDLAGVDAFCRLDKECRALL